MDTNGDYRFTNITQSGLIIQAVPDTHTFWYLMPTYLGDVIFWNEADTLTLNNPQPDTITCQPSPLLMRGASTIIGSVLSYITGKRAADPIKNADVTLKGIATGGLSGYTRTDENGEFRFNNVVVGGYRLFVDYPGIPMSIENEVQVTSSGQVIFVNVRVDSTIITLEVIYTAVPELNITSIEAFPNPTSDKVFIKLHSREYQNIRLLLHDLDGRLIFNREHALIAGSNTLEADLSGLNGSVYFLSVMDREGKHLSRVIKVAVAR